MLDTLAEDMKPWEPVYRYSGDNSEVEAVYSYGDSRLTVVMQMLVGLGAGQPSVTLGIKVVARFIGLPELEFKVKSLEASMNRALRAIKAAD
jgi:hypothetical protein